MDNYHLSIPYFPEYISIETHGEVYYLYNNNLKNAVLLDNDSAKEIIKIIDGKSRIIDIAYELNNIFDLPDNYDLVNDIFTFIKKLNDENFLELKTNIP